MTPLVELLKPTRCLLLDFDGPVCSVFAGYPAATIAAELRAIVADHLGQLTPHLAGVTGPHQLVRLVAELDRPELTRRVAGALRDAELVAIRTAVPTPGIVDVLTAAEDVGPPVGIVSNNHADAVRRYLHDHGLIRYIEVLACRTDRLDPREMKPHPLLVRAALAPMRAEPTETVLVGDAVTDIEAARAAGVAAIGYANRPGKHTSLLEAGASATIQAMTEIANALYTGADAARP